MHNITAINDGGTTTLVNEAGTSNSRAKVSGSINKEINSIESMEFAIYADNPSYESMIPFKTRIESVNVDGEFEFFGRVLKAKASMSTNGEICKNVVCENYMGFLQDSTTGFRHYEGTVQSVINQLFQKHCESIRTDTFVLKECDINETISIDSEGETTYALIMNKIINVYGGEFDLMEMKGTGRSRTFYLRLRSDEYDISPNDIEIGNNLISYSSDVDVTNICTYLIPYGAKIYTDEDNLERIDITSVNGGKNFISVESEYGKIERTLLLQDIEEPQELLEEAQKYLEEHKYPTITYQITAFDNHLINKSIPKFSLRERHYVTAPILGIDHILLKITKKTICIENPANDTFTIGASLDSASSAVSGAVTANDINRVYDKMNTNDTINAYQINAVNARINNLDVGDLTAVNAKIQNLQADNAKIQSLIFGTADGNYISVEFSDAVVSQISDGVITNAMIKSLAADKLSAGRISTNLIDIGSDDGMLTIKDNTIQCYDGEHVRVQLGKDVNGDYNLVLCDADGKVLWDAKGLGEAGIRNDLIVDRMVSKDAAIHGSKIDMPSLIREINNGTETIRSSSIVYDADGQSLDIAFNKIESQLLDDLGYNLYSDSRTMMEGWVYKGNWAWDNIDKFRAGTSSDYAYLDSTFMLTERVTYTLSAWVKGKVFIYYPTALEIDTEYEEYSDWTKVSYTFVYDCRKGKPVFSSEGYFSIYGIKLEYGGALTEWCETAEEINRASLIEITNIEIKNGNISFDLYKKDGLVEQTASLTMRADQIQATVNKIEGDYSSKSQLTQTAEMIKATVAKSQPVWDTGTDEIDYIGYGEPEAVAGIKAGEHYLNQETGKLYVLYFDNTAPAYWKYEKSYSKITENLQSKILQTSESITQEVSRATSAENTLSGRITVTADNITQEVRRAQGAENSLSASISLKIGKDDNDQIVSMINASANQITLDSNRLVVNSDQFKLDKYGNATFSGEINGASGTFAGDLEASTTYFNGLFSKNRSVMIDGVSGRIYSDLTGDVTGNIYNEELLLAGVDRVRMYVMQNQYLGVAVDGNSSGKYHFRPGMNGNIDCGSSSYHWDNIYADNGEIQTSDRNEKMFIEDMKEEYANMLIDGSLTKTYQMKNGNSGRTHAGMIAQDLEQQLLTAGMTSKDFAGFIKYEKEVEGIPTGQYGYGIRYEEYIAPLIKYCQCLKRDLKQEIFNRQQIQLQILSLQGEISILKQAGGN